MRLFIFLQWLMRYHNYPILYINVWRKVLIFCVGAGLRAVGVDDPVGGGRKKSG